MSRRIGFLQSFVQQRPTSGKEPPLSRQQLGEAQRHRSEFVEQAAQSSDGAYPSQPGSGGQAQPSLRLPSETAARLAQQLTASARTRTINVVDVQRALPAFDALSAAEVAAALCELSCRGFAVTDAAKATAFASVPGLELDTGLRYREGPVNTFLLEVDHAVFAAMNGGEPVRPEAMRAIVAASWVAVAASPTPGLVARYLHAQLSTLKASEHVAGGAGNLVELTSLLDSLEALGLRAPTGTPTLAALERGFMADAHLFAVTNHGRRRSVVSVDFDSLLRELRIGTAISEADAYYLITYCESFLASRHRILRGASTRLDAAELQHLEHAVESIPDSLIGGYARDTLRHWARTQREGAPQGKVHHRLPFFDPRQELPRHLSEVGKDPELTRHLVEGLFAGHVDPGILYSYVQREAGSNLLSDVALAYRSVYCMHKLLSTLFTGGREIDEHRDELRHLQASYADGFLDIDADDAVRRARPQLPPERRVPEISARPFDPDRFVDMLVGVVREESAALPPRMGEFPDWSQEFRRDYLDKFRPITTAPRLLILLAQGKSWMYQPTGHEAALEAFITSQPLGTVQFDQLFRQAYRLGQGDVTTALLAMENVLCEHWLEPDREELLLTQCLAPIANHGTEGNKYGCWYHLVGMMLYGMLEGRVPSTAVGEVETMGSWVLNKLRDPEYQETWINHMGGTIGARLAHAVRTGDWETRPLNVDATDPSRYLSLAPSHDAAALRRAWQLDRA